MSTTLLTARELAKLLGVLPKTLYTWVASGRVTAERSLTNRLRFNPEAVRADYERAGVALPALFSAHIAGLKRAPKDRRAA
jgi:excisionase family DNA binding protein